MVISRYSKTSKKNKSADIGSSQKRGPKRDIKKSRLYEIVSSKAVRLLIVVLIVVGILGFIGRMISAQIVEMQEMSFSSHYQSGLDVSDRSSVYESEDVFTVLVVVEGDNEEKSMMEGFVLIRLDPISHKVDVISLHPDVYVPIQSGFGRILSTLDLEISRLRDLMIVGELQTTPMPLAYTQYQLEELYAMEIDGYIVIPASMYGTLGNLGSGDEPWTALESKQGYEEWTQEWVEYWVEYMESISVTRAWVNRNLIPMVGSNMDVLSVYSFARDFSQVSEENVHKLVLDDDELVDVIDERGETVNSVGIASIDDLLEDLSISDVIDREQARVEILNGTNVGGLGSRYERWVSHMGMDVIRVKNAPDKNQHTVIYVTDIEKYTYTMGRIMSLWEAEIEVVEGRPDFVTTGDIIIVLGMDF